MLVFWPSHMYVHSLMQMGMCAHKCTHTYTHTLKHDLIQSRVTYISQDPCLALFLRILICDALNSLRQVSAPQRLYLPISSSFRTLTVQLTDRKQSPCSKRTQLPLPGESSLCLWKVPEDTAWMPTCDT